ncbi:hypothetical protein GCK72_025937 [Caenorhabditis remanei]|uniref:RING-type domain-containing protein n=1 Tax=Caenorhabditis remanei TaxID=31234 RepID=A0A6A5G4Q4_CAERE|nr:hypothetical protein GCK72_025937 [Caenorhabditis remanei]KAF1749469.1 hypothetical protein GCK72_025937 [Caenorhabditis remanei]
MNQPKKSPLDLNKENADLRNQLMQISKHRDSLNKEKALLQTKNEALQKENDALGSSLQKLKQSSTALKENNIQLKKELQISQNKELISDDSILQNQLQEIMKIRNQLDAENSSLKSELDKTKSNLDTMKQKYGEKCDEVYSFHKKLTLVTSELDGFKISEVNYSKNKQTVNTDDKKWEVRYGQLSEKVTDFTQEVFKREKDLPVLGRNNAEEIEMQAFNNFVILNSLKLEKFVSDIPSSHGSTVSSANNSVELSASPPETKNEETVCKMCHRKQFFVTCKNVRCKSIFHEECIRVFFNTKTRCPCCDEGTFDFPAFQSRDRY